VTLLIVLAAVAGGVAYWRRRSASGGRGAGASAAAKARRLRTPLVRVADAFGVSTAGGRQATRWEAGAAGERATAARLNPLRSDGWTILHDRALPTGRANVDHLTISPSGAVIVVDSKKWSARYPLRVVRGRLLHGDRDVTARLNGIRHEAETVGRVLGCRVEALVSMDGPHIDGRQLLVDGIRIVPAQHVAANLRALGHRRPVRGAHPGKAAAELFKPYRQD
jgi:hypothetical protein